MDTVHDASRVARVVGANDRRSNDGGSLRWVVLAIIVVGLALSSPYSFAMRVQPGGAILLTPTPARAIAYWLAWAAAVPMLVAASRSPLTVRPTAPRVALHVALGLAGSGAHALVFGFFERLASAASARVVLSPQTFLFETLRGLWEYALFLTAIQVVLIARSYRLQTRAAARQQTIRTQLEAELARAEVAALQAQLHPHFLFNALNSISVLTMQSPEAARDATIQLGALLRTVMQRSRDQLLTLRQELDVVDRYLGIQRVRFGDRLRVEMHVDDDAMNALVPTMLVQPLVENAIRHAIEVAGKGRITLVARRDGGELSLCVEDDGADGAGASPGGSGVGLDNLRRRLDLLFDGQARLDLRRRPDGGTKVSVAMPFRTEAHTVSR